MNPLFAAVARTIFRYRRTCLQCKREQVVSGNKKTEVIICKFCGAKIPPLDVKK